MKEIIMLNKNKLDFGDYNLDEKVKDTIELNGIKYRVKTHEEITRLERDELMIYESVPGTNVYNFSYNSEEIYFDVEGKGNTSLIIAVNQDKTYNIFVNNEEYLSINILAGGKIQFLINFDENERVAVRLVNTVNGK